MDFDVLAAAAALHPARSTPIVPVPGALPDAVAERPRTTLIADAVPPPTKPRRVELSFHHDLRVLITKLVDESTGDVVSQLPADQVLDLVADVMTRIRTREQG